ncbi:MAG: hypothetical protein MI750_03465 [Xanthomonadales bacterium]|nr:hypothetical protein [Xanthomonadales bacterium]
MKQKVILRCALFVLAAVVLSACGPQGENLRDAKPELPPNSAGARAVKLWQAKIKRNFTAAYPYYTPGYRSTTPLLQFVDNFPGGRVVWNDVEYANQDCDASKCIVELDVTYSYINPAPGVESVTNTRRVKETWLLIDGAWYFSP